jgi:hypothetical protein
MGEPRDAYATVPCADCGAPTDPRWLGKCREHEPSLHRCEDCGGKATSKKQIGGIACWRCAACAVAAEQQAQADMAGLTKQHAQHWQRVHHSDPRALEMADRHYSRQSPGTPEFTPSGHKIVLMHFLDDSTPAALWASHRPAPGKAVRADGLDAWACTMFRVEHRTVLASELIREAVAITRALWQPLPTDGFYTTIDPRKVAPIKRRGECVWGYCYIKAGWRLRAERTKDKNLIVLTLPLSELEQIEPIEAQLVLPPFGTAWRRWPRQERQREAVQEVMELEW